MSWNLRLDVVERLLGSLPSTAVETGTCLGNATRYLAKRFHRVISIELSETLHARARARFSETGFDHVRLIRANSSEALPQVLGELSPDEPVFIFLDAHWSGDSTVDWRSSRWKGFGFDTSHLGAAGKAPFPHEQCPLADELMAIMQHCRSRACVLIDDMKNIPSSGSGLKDHEFVGEDWSHLSRDRLLSIVEPRLERIETLKDPEQWLLLLHPAESATPAEER